MLGRIEHLCLFFLLLHPFWLCGQVDTISVFFDTDRSELKPSDKDLIDSLLGSYEEGLIQNIDLLGRADHRGGAQYNLELSVRRANSVALFIQDHFPALVDKINKSGFGEDEHLSDLKTKRRVDVKVTYAAPQVRLEDSYTPDAIPVESLNVGNILKIKGLNFHRGRSVLLPKSIPHLKDLEKLLNKYPTLEIEIQGHVCCLDKQKNGNDGYNLDTKENNLSISRARNIYNYLVRKGISPDRLGYDGFGATSPIVYPEESENDRIQNRRVELLITKL